MDVVATLRRSVFPRLWFMPVVGAVVAIAISVVTVWADRTFLGISVPIIGAAPAQIASVFAVIATSILNLLALVFTILIVVLQLTSSQYSHRALRTLLQDQQSRVTLGVFVATYTHALIVLAALGTSETDERFAGFSVLSTFVLAIVSIVVFLLFIDHIAQSIRVTSIISEIGSETRRLIDRIHPEPYGSPEHNGARPTVHGPPGTVVRTKGPGVVSRVDTERLLEAACDSGCELRLLHALGDFVPSGAPLIEIRGRQDGLDDIGELVVLGSDRSMEQDVAFGVRQLVDVAERALSPGTNDPTIAVHALDQIHDVLRTLAGRQLSSGLYFDRNGDARLAIPAPSWEDYVSLGIDEIRHYGERSVQVARRLHAMLEDLLAVAPAERKAPLRTQLDLLRASVDRAFADEHDRRRARSADLQGLGAGTRTPVHHPNVDAVP